MQEGKHYIVKDFGDTEVGKKYERPVWSGFRIWESVKSPIPLTTDFEKLKRTINSIGNPPFDILSEWLMDFSTISAGQLGRTDWENFRNLVLVHVPGCQSTCWYCFNDAWESSKKCKCGKVSVKTILDKFLNQQRRNADIKGKHCNILRLSGGEPFTQPAFVRDLALEIAERNKTIFLWLDTNLFGINAKGKEKEIKEALNALKRLDSNLAIHACFHGISDESIKKTTGLEVGIDDLILNYKTLVDLDLNVYPRFNPCVCTPDEAETFFIKLFETDETIPLRIYLGIVELYYPAGKERMKEVKKLLERGERKDKPYYHSPQAVIFWWNKIMQLAYGVGYGVIPRHICNSYPKKKNPFLNINSDGLKRKIAKRDDKPDREVLFISKGSFKEIYAMKVLEALAQPSNSRMTIEYHRRYVEPNLYHYLDVFPETYTDSDKDVLIVATHPQKRDEFHMAFLRWGKLKNIENTPVSTNIEVELSYYPYFEREDVELNGVKNFEKIADYLGSRNLPVNGYFIQLMGFPSQEFPMVTDETKVHQDEAFFQVIECLNNAGWKGLNSNIYYRVASIRRTADDKDIDFSNGRLDFSPGDEIEIKLVSFNPNLGNSGFPREDEAILSISTTAKENVTIISRENIRLSKFGQHIIRLRLKEEDIEFKGEIIIKPKKEIGDTKIFELILPFNCEPGEFTR